eukprot:TsM_000196300 transcript=TsM_000196300 gene=TsM_000196300
MFHTPTVNVIAAPGMLPTHPPTPMRRVDEFFHQHALVKKQRMERVRRARISDKIAQLHGLTPSMIGMDVREVSVSMEKLEMLGFCHEMLSSLHSLLVERPDMMERLKACHRGGIVTSAVCRNITFDSPTISRSGCCESGVYVPSISVPQSSTVDSNGVNRTDCRLTVKKC